MKATVLGATRLPSGLMVYSFVFNGEYQEYATKGGNKDFADYLKRLKESA